MSRNELALLVWGAHAALLPLSPASCLACLFVHMNYLKRVRQQELITKKLVGTLSGLILIALKLQGNESATD